MSLHRFLLQAGTRIIGPTVSLPLKLTTKINNKIIYTQVYSRAEAEVLDIFFFQISGKKLTMKIAIFLFTVMVALTFAAPLDDFEALLVDLLVLERYEEISKKVGLYTLFVTIYTLLYNYRASNSPALRGSLPPGLYFSRSLVKHVKYPASMKNPGRHIKSPALVAISGENLRK